MPHPEDKCETCKYWTAFDNAVAEDVGQCHRYPTTVTKKDDEGCGEHTPAVPGPPE